MRKLTGFVLILVLAGVSSTFAIQQVAPRLNVVDLYAGFSNPLGSYNGIAGVEFISERGTVDVDAKNIYKDGLHFGVNFGRINNGHVLTSVGFTYTRFEVKNPVVQPRGSVSDAFDIPVPSNVDPALSQYDLDLHLGYFPYDLMYTPWSPFFGLGVAAGISSFGAEGFDSETQVALALGIDFGADVKVWKASDDRGFVTLSSINSWDFFSTSDRPKTLNIGFGLKYYFRQ